MAFGVSSSLEGTSKAPPLGGDAGEAVLATDRALGRDFSEFAAGACVNVEGSSG
jgi:hypothetical protein